MVPPTVVIICGKCNKTVRYQGQVVPLSSIGQAIKDVANYDYGLIDVVKAKINFVKYKSPLLLQKEYVRLYKHLKNDQEKLCHGPDT